jgi:hypothetical protein
MQLKPRLASRRIEDRRHRLALSHTLEPALRLSDGLDVVPPDVQRIRRIETEGVCQRQLYREARAGGSAGGAI